MRRPSKNSFILRFSMTTRSPFYSIRETTHVDCGNNNIVGVCSLNFYIAWKCVIITLTSFIFTGNVYLSQMTTKNGFINLVLPLIFETQNYQWRRSFTNYISNTLWNTLLLLIWNHCNWSYKRTSWVLYINCKMVLLNSLLMNQISI